MNRILKILLILLSGILIFSPFYKLSKKEKQKKLSIISGEIKAGDKLSDILKKEGISEKECFEIIEKLKEIFNPKNCKIGDTWELFVDRDGNFLKFKYYSKPFDFYIVEKEKDSLVLYTEKIKSEKKLFNVKGEIKSSLYESMIDSNIEPEIIMQFAEIFESKIDFFTDCQTNDKFSVLWEGWVDEKGNILKNEKIVAAKYNSTKHIYYGFYFEKNNFKGYFDENGKGLQSGFLKAPLSFRKITSFFSKSRFHPIYKVYRPHLGIDYSAPVGTPISAIGKGTIIFAGYLGGYGKCIKIKHPNGYISYYGHLSRFGERIKVGKKVEKGEIIGYVGMSGVATGPHLDFRVQMDGKFIDFLKLKFVPEKNITKEYMDEFEEIKKKYLELLD